MAKLGNGGMTGVRSGFGLGLEDNFRVAGWPAVQMPGTEGACACCEPQISHPLPLCGTCRERSAPCCLVERYPRLTGVEAASWGMVRAAIAVVESKGLEDRPEAAAGLLAALRGILEGIGIGLGNQEEGSDG